MAIKTIQLIYDPISAFANGGFCNFQIPVQGYYDVIIKQAEIYGQALGVEQIMAVNSPQLKSSYTCYSSNGTDGIVQNALGISPLSSNFVLVSRNTISTIIEPIIIRRCILQNTIQMSIRDPIGTPLQNDNLVIFTIELHQCRDVFDTSIFLPFV